MCRLVTGFAKRQFPMHFPPDAVLLPVSRGALLVSVSHAVFCPIPHSELGAVWEILSGRGSVMDLSTGLVESMRDHGIFAPPQPVEPNHPVVQIQLTNACNLDCAYCCTNSGVARPSEITFADVQHVLSETNRLLGPSTQIALLGGEPLLVPWALDAADLALDIGFDLTLFTNGLPLVSSDLAQRAAMCMARGMELRVSLAGPTPDLCDAASGAPRFAQVIAAIHAMVALGGQPIVDLMLLPEHVEQCGKHLPSLRSLLPPDVVVCIGLAYLSGRERGQHVFPTRQTLEAAMDYIAFEAGEVIPGPKLSPKTKRRDGCGCALGHRINVRSDGALFTCFKMEECVGHLRDGFVEVLRAVMADPHPANTLDTCKDCPLVSLCGGGCRSDNFLYTADPNRPLCDTWRVQVLAELLFEDNVHAITWPAHHLLAEAHARNIPSPTSLQPARNSLNLCDVPIARLTSRNSTRRRP